MSVCLFVIGTRRETAAVRWSCKTSPVRGGFLRESSAGESGAANLLTPAFTPESRPTWTGSSLISSNTTLDHKNKHAVRGTNCRVKYSANATTTTIISYFWVFSLPSFHPPPFFRTVRITANHFTNFINGPLVFLKMHLIICFPLSPSPSLPY